MNCLIVEDDPDLAFALACCLEEMGHSCEITPTVGMAMASLKTRKFELVLLDYLLPDGVGLPVSNYAALFCPEVRIILLTGRAVFAYGEHQKIAPGIDWVLRKPACLVDLSALVEYAEIDARRKRTREPARV